MKKGTKLPEKPPTRTGRPAIGEPLRVRMSDVMLEQLREQAAAHGMNVSEYVRSLILADLKAGK